MPGDLALLLGAAPLVAQGRRALPPLADRVLLADVARKHPGYFAPVAETPGFGEALFRLVRELRGAGYDLSDLGPLLDGATDAPEKAGSLAEILAEFERRRSGFYGPDDALLAAEPPGWTGSRCSSGGCSTFRRRSSACCTGSPSGCRSTSTSPTCPRRPTLRWPSSGVG